MRSENSPAVCDEAAEGRLRDIARDFNLQTSGCFTPARWRWRRQAALGVLKQHPRFGARRPHEDPQAVHIVDAAIDA